MMCSQKELGVGEDHSGIWILPEDTPVGEDLARAAKLDNVLLEIGVTANRGDCLSVIGIARDLAAITGKRFRVPEIRPNRVGGEIERKISVDIEDPDLCPRYTGMMVRDVTIRPSPQWMASRLRAVGIRPINNIVDVTNYVLMEYGQPLHAFDYDLLTKHAIVVRRARDGEVMRTLDEQDRKLNAQNLLICDGPTPVAMAGIMGGLNTEIEANSRNVFIESAYFDPVNIRKTSRQVGLSSESSIRFERGVDSEGVVSALHRAAQLMEQLGGGSIVRGYIDNYPKSIPRSEVKLRPTRVEKVLGVRLSAQRIRDILLSLGMEIEPVSQDLFRVVVPSYRGDVTREVDLIEEIARIHGYDKVPLTLPDVSKYEKPLSDSYRLRDRIREAMCSMGFYEVITHGFGSAAAQDRFRIETGSGDYLRLLNPMNEDQAVMKDCLLPGILDCLDRNLKRGGRDVRIFELRPVFLYRGQEELPDEQYHLAFLGCGSMFRRGWRSDDQDLDFFDAKGVLEELFETMGLEDVDYEAVEAPFLHPGRSAAVSIQGRRIGLIGQVHPKLLESLEINARPVMCELEFEPMLEFSKAVMRYEGISRYPAVYRDLALVVDEQTRAGDLVRAIKDLNIKIVQDVEIFDIYRGASLGEGKKSIAFSLVYQSDEKSLTDEAVDKVQGLILEKLGVAFGAVLRGPEGS